MRDVSTSLDMTKTLFTALHVYGEDASPHSAAMNMAIDEALFEIADAPTIRFYRWDHPALSFGYFGKFSDVQNLAQGRDLVRRWTGGGIVFHGKDLTYSIVIPSSDQVFNNSSLSIYQDVHRAIQRALVKRALPAELAPVAALYERRTNHAAVIDRRYSECFANPVAADVMLNGRKVAGAAQRRTRRGLLQQGSIQGFEMADDFPQRFTDALAERFAKKEIAPLVLDRARAIAAEKYATEAWLRKR